MTGPSKSAVWSHRQSGNSAIPSALSPQLWHDRGKNWRDARVELNQRFAFPVACFVFALIAVPLGSQPRRGGRAAGTLLAVVVIGAYYLLSFWVRAWRARESFPRGSACGAANVFSPWLVCSPSPHGTLSR